MSDELTRRPRMMDALAAAEADPDIEIAAAEPDPALESDKPTPDAAAEELAAKLKSADEENARLRAEAVEARRQAAEAGNTVFTAAQRAVAERESSVTSAIEARNQTIESAEAALKAAMDANDSAAMSKAQRAIARAEAELVQLEQAKAAVETDKQRLKDAPPPRQNEEPQMSDETRRWLDTHPRFNADPDYQQAVLAADRAWCARYGRSPQSGWGSQKYVDFIEANMTARFGEGHGDLKAVKAQPRSGARERPASSTAARADGGMDIGGGGNRANEFPHASGKLVLTRTADGKEQLSGKIPAAWVEGAKWSGYIKGAPIPGSGGKKFASDQEAAHAYALEQVHILQEQRAGGSAGIQWGEGGVLQ